VSATDTSPAFYVGTASWTDPTLLAAGFYPSRARTAEARLHFYAEHFNTVEVDSTYYALPSERNAALWALRTPADFRFNVKAFAWLTQHGAETRALPSAIKALLPAPALRQARLSHPPADAVQLSFEMFRAALEPLRSAGKLGCILFQFPPWFTATAAHAAYLDVCRTWMPHDQLAIEFRHASWFGEHTQQTLALLAERQLSLVCLDAPQAPSIPRVPYVATSPIAYVRLHGRNRQSWFQRAGTAAQRFKYLYSDDELRDCAASIRGLRLADPHRGVAGARTVHVIFNNCYADYGARNALTMQHLLGGVVREA
jgi:uncharacterized protein YecE (DUF72 family)